MSTSWDDSTYDDMTDADAVMYHANHLAALRNEYQGLLARGRHAAARKVRAEGATEIAFIRFERPGILSAVKEALRA